MSRGAPPRHACDIQFRAGLAKASWGTLSKSFYSKSYVSVHSKTQVFQSLSMSRLIYNDHTWCSATNADWIKWQNYMRKPVGPMVKHMLQGGGLEPGAKMLIRLRDRQFEVGGAFLPRHGVVGVSNLHLELA